MAVKSQVALQASDVRRSAGRGGTTEANQARGRRAAVRANDADPPRAKPVELPPRAAPRHLPAPASHQPVPNWGRVDEADGQLPA